jgi:meromycolic acid enoyl-[acyl-carrier-protein] reductase
VLADKRLIVTGIVNADSIAFAVAERAQLMGAELVATVFPRDRAAARAAIDQLPRRADVVELDATDPGGLDALTDHVRDRLGGLDGALHAIAFAPRDALSGDFLEATAEGVELSFRTSVHSYAGLGRVLSRLAPQQGGSLVGLDFDAARAWPVYNWMGVCKAALESANRYLARDLGPQGIRANLIAAGPLATRAAGGIGGFDRLLEAWEASAPMRWDPTDAGPVADAACFLLSDLARAITGEILHVDGGHHAVSGALRVPEAAREAVGAGASAMPQV